MIRIGVVGAGHWGPHLIRNFHNRQESIVVGVADLDDRRLHEISERYPEIRTTKDAREIVVSPDTDAVVVVTPTTTHFPLAKLALESRKHVLVEKPLASSSVHAEELWYLP